ncbi:PEP-CTERM sorting domain-containing protein [Aquabacterium sp. A7-Y]|uniref:PEP-CTERM sorting domain-containing protein n=1 Tax=Aquabacterium sp. A7-Y TaxID=1349605 RepID=UPI00223CD824|nr:PEP-CTERM sorting domain-containing protein [Aquabacterium sp. A7-Y]MCW7540450.1 PEP-CTERM sorting domain-containing protein [Aquabacterium sp. A7-Y]
MAVRKIIAAAAAAVFMLPAVAQEFTGDVIDVDPYAGGAGYITWGWDPIYPGDPYIDTWRLVTGAQQQWVQLKLEDIGFPGDNFEVLTLNGAKISWDSYVPGIGHRDSTTGSQRAEGQVRLLLEANTTYTLGVTATPCQFGCDYGGGAWYVFTPLGPVPEPSTYALMLGGVVALLARRRAQGRQRA